MREATLSSYQLRFIGLVRSTVQCPASKVIMFAACVSRIKNNCSQDCWRMARRSEFWLALPARLAFLDIRFLGSQLYIAGY